MKSTFVTLISDARVEDPRGGGGGGGAWGKLKSNIIKYISSSSILPCNLIEGPSIDKVTGTLGDLWGVTTKIVVHWEVRNKTFES